MAARLPASARPHITRVGVWPILSMAMLVARRETEGHRDALAPAMTPDSMFEHFLAAFRVHFDAALQAESAGPARHIRAYVLAMCSGALSDDGTHRHQLVSTLDHPQCRALWSEFVDELFAEDSLDADVMLLCRYATDGLWHARLPGHAAPAGDVEAVCRLLLALTAAIE